MNIQIEKPENNEEIKYAFNSTIANEIISDLQNRGFNYLFKLNEESIFYKHCNISFEHFDILEVHNFENVSQDERYVLYAVKCDKYNIKGVILNPFGIYANDFTKMCISKIINNEKLIFKYY